MIHFRFDIDNWVFPLCFRYTLVGHDHRPWTFRIEFLCFALTLCIDEDSR